MGEATVGADSAPGDAGMVAITACVGQGHRRPCPPIPPNMQEVPLACRAGQFADFSSQRIGAYVAQEAVFKFGKEVSGHGDLSV